MRWRCCGLLLSAVLVAAGGCDERDESRSVASAPPTVQASQSRNIVEQGSEWVVATADLKSTRVALIGQSPPRVSTFEAARDRLEQAKEPWLFLTNAGIFEKGARPLGLQIESSKVVNPINRGEGTGNFFLKPNGVFFIKAAKPYIVATSRYQPGAGVELATQSGPLLITSGQLSPILKASSTSRNTRSAVCLNDEGHVVLAVSRQKLSFYDAAQYLLQELHCRDALYLDGTISDYETPGRRSGRNLTYGGFLAVISR